MIFRLVYRKRIKRRGEKKKKGTRGISTSFLPREVGKEEIVFCPMGRKEARGKRKDNISPAVHDRGKKKERLMGGRKGERGGGSVL